MDIYFATKNKGKIASAERALLRHGFRIVPVETGINEPENTNNSTAIVRARCLAAIEKFPGPVISENGGLFVRALGFGPGVKTYSYMQTPNEQGLIGVQKMMAEMGKDGDRQAYFINVLGYIEQGLVEPVCFETKIEGEISHTLRGGNKRGNWSQAAMVFMPQGFNKTIAEMKDEEYRRFSMINSNFRKLLNYLEIKFQGTAN